MGAWLIYMIKSTFCLALFFVFYKALLGKETFHAFNRYVMLGIVFISFLLPVFQFTVPFANPAQQIFTNLENYVILDEAIVTGNNIVEEEFLVTSGELPVSYYLLPALFVIWLIGAGIRLFLFCRSYMSIRRMLHKYEKILFGKYVLIILPGLSSPFSWWKYIFLSEEDYKDNPDEILQHEIAHIRKKHSLDIILCEILTMLQWYNPVSYLFKREMQAIHEYQADMEVLKNGVNPSKYQLLLIKKAVGCSSYTLANSLNHSSLKKRITMMLKEKSNRWAQLKAFIFLPLAIVALSAFARPDIAMLSGEKAPPSENTPIEEFSSNKDTKSSEAATAQDDKIYSLEELTKRPEFSEESGKIERWIAKNLQYPSEAKNKNIQGRNFVAFTISTDGSVTDVKIDRSSGNDLLDKEALRVVSAMPKWKPGEKDGMAVKVIYRIPITFKLTAPPPPPPPGTKNK